MRQIYFPLLAACTLVLAGCTRLSMPTEERVLEICRHIPNPEHLEDSRPFLTADFYDALETMINIPDSTEVLHEWEFWFVTADGSPMAQGHTSIESMTSKDRTHVVVTVIIVPEDTDYEAEEHILLLEQVGPEWRLTDLDDYKSAAQARQ